MIAAIFVETNGCYFGLPDVDPWDILRDARKYDGPYPVIAHPPCQRWGNFARGSMARQVHQIGDDGGCFESALASLRAFGGVLEHPANSKAWARFGIAKPSKSGWTPAGDRLWTCEVEQGHYGHKARKKTWLLVSSVNKPRDLIWGSSGQRLPEKRLAERGYKSASRCGIVATMSSKQRQRTPVKFRDLLIEIARECMVN